MILELHDVSSMFTWLFCEKKHIKYLIMLSHYTALT